MKYALLTVSALLLMGLLQGCPAPADTPVTVNRGTGVEVVSSQTVVIVPIVGSSDDFTAGTRTQRALVKWLKDNPAANIVHMVVIGNNGFPREVVLIVEGELGTQ